MTNEQNNGGVTVAKLAKRVGLTEAALLERLKSVGVEASGADQVLTAEQIKLLAKTKTTARSSLGLKRPKLKLSAKSGSGGPTIQVRKSNLRIKQAIQAHDLAEKEKVEAKRLADERKAAGIVESPVAAKESPEEKTVKETQEKSEKTADSVDKSVDKAKPATEEVKKPEEDKRKEVKERVFEQEDLQGFNRRKQRRRKKSKRALVSDSQTFSGHQFAKPVEPTVMEVEVPETISVASLAQKMSVKATEVIKVMMGMGAMATINQLLDQETAILVVEEMGHTPKPLLENELEQDLLADWEGDEIKQGSRPPVVTIMGHVDHGKTSLLDYIRRSKVTSGEAGGITQHIGAYQVNTNKGPVTFLDTPGHEAFTAMRARGANATDIVILVVAADDGVKPQTIEAIQHANAAKVPLIIAVNKMDKPEADPERVKTELGSHGIVPEDWGGEVMFQHISAKTGEGVDSLLDSISVLAEVLELKAPINGPAKGVVIESHLDKGHGAVATILVQSGALNKADILLVGQEYGRVRLMVGGDGKPLLTAGPSMPIKVSGLSGAPLAGDDALVVSNERKAREVALFRQGKYREVKLARQASAKLENLFKEGASQLNVVLKTDVQGSLEAITESLLKIDSDEVKVTIVSSGVGGISESDANLALVSNAIIIGFNVRADIQARKVIETNSIDLHYYSIIYNLMEEVKLALSGMLSPERKEDIIGLAEVKEVHRSSKIGAIAGCIVSEGVVKRDCHIRVLRNHVVVYEGVLESLRRFKDDVKDVRSGTECGIGVKDYNDVQVKDQIEAFEVREIKRTIS